MSQSVTEKLDDALSFEFASTLSDYDRLAGAFQTVTEVFGHVTCNKKKQSSVECLIQHEFGFTANVYCVELTTKTGYIVSVLMIDNVRNIRPVKESFDEQLKSRIVEATKQFEERIPVKRYCSINFNEYIREYEVDDDFIRMIKSCGHAKMFLGKETIEVDKTGLGGLAELVQLTNMYADSDVTPDVVAATAHLSEIKTMALLDRGGNLDDGLKWFLAHKEYFQQIADRYHAWEGKLSKDESMKLKTPLDELLSGNKRYPDTDYSKVLQESKELWAADNEKLLT